MHGFHTGLGIHHCSRDNPVNLSCDLMEPFRPIVDRIVYESESRPLDWDLRKKLIALTDGTCRLDGKQQTVENAIEGYTLNVLNAVKNGIDQLMEVDIV